MTCIITPVIFYTNSTNLVAVSNVPDEPEIWFTVKSNALVPDELSTIQIGKVEGLIFSNGVSASTAGLSSSDGTITVSGSVAMIYISASAAPIIYGTLPNDFLGEVKTKTTASIVTVVAQFPVEVRRSLTRRI